MRKLVRQLRHGQITIPKEMREALRLKPDDLLSVECANGKLNMEPVRPAPEPKGSPWLLELYEMFAPVREGLKGYSEDEINDAIDEALREVRAREA